MKAIVTVIGSDKIGIIAKVSNALSDIDVNILDISQTVLSGFFTMMMLVDLTKCTARFADVTERLKEIGRELDAEIRIQRTEIFEAMHHI